MHTEPKLEQREQQHYVAIPVRVSMDSIGKVLPPLMGEVFGWLAQKGVAPDGPPFFKFVVIDMKKGMDMEVGVPVATAQKGDGRVKPGAFPAGRYATVVHVGPYERIIDTTADLLAWADKKGITWRSRETDKGDAWDARTEFYLSDPQKEPDPAKWRTELAFLTAS